MLVGRTASQVAEDVRAVTYRGAMSELADPDMVRREIESLLAEMRDGAAPVPQLSEEPASAQSMSAQGILDAALDTAAGVDIARRASILEQAHDVLTQALATVDQV